ncbi:hypothetical protein ANN_26396 [Periplaneta americana]|uniref:DUF4817 domain-containing protein n=1 Tax=Periplaneta americana TaxID=6978 RepID=A0ABQ8RXY6_PERAM|nr:hypothetical protein ANN_26396 [Periplaneta americana]
MILLYGEARGNGRAARSIYRDRYPQCPTTSHTLFAIIRQRLRERGTFTASRNDCGAPRRRRTPELEEAVLHQLEGNPSTSTRAIARVRDVTPRIVWNVKHEQQLQTYYLQRIHSLQPADFPPRVQFCKWFLYHVFKRL